MIPVTQSRTGENGRCLEASIASLLEIPEAAVPDFGSDDTYLRNMAKFLKPYGLYYVQVSADNPALKMMFAANNDIWTTVEGISHRGRRHACVAKSGKLVWDPHPDDGTAKGLRIIENYGLLGMARCLGSGMRLIACIGQ